MQTAVTERCLPLRCVVCRTKILKLKHQPTQLHKQHQKNSDSQAKTPANSATAAPEEQRLSSSNTSQPSCTSSTRRTEILKLKHQPTQLHKQHQKNSDYQAQTPANPAAAGEASCRHDEVQSSSERHAARGAGCREGSRDAGSA